MFWAKYNFEIILNCFRRMYKPTFEGKLWKTCYTEWTPLQEIIKSSLKVNAPNEVFQK